jgi:hypothetical protein
MIGRGKPTAPAPFSLKEGFYNQKQLMMSHQKLLLIKNIIFLIKKAYFSSEVTFD